MSSTQKNGYVSFSRNTKRLKEEKERLRAEGYPLAEVRKLVRSVVTRYDFPADAVLVVAPSTSRTNPLPFEICLALAGSKNIPIIDDLLSTKNEQKTSQKSGIGKLRDPVRLTFDREPDELRGKTVFIVDDVVTTGGTTDAMRESLAEKGIFVSGVISMGQSEFYLTRKTDIERITKKLGDPPLKDELETMLGGRLRHLGNYIEREINDTNRTEFRRLISVEAKRLNGLDQRTREYLGSATAMASRLQSREGR